MTGKSVIGDLGASAANLVLYSVSWVAALHVVRPLLNSLGAHEPTSLYVAASVVWAGAGAVSAFWSRALMATVVPGMVAFFFWLGGLKFAITLTDTVGGIAPPLWSFVSAPSWGELWAGAARTHRRAGA